MSSARIGPRCGPWVQKEGPCPASDSRNKAARAVHRQPTGSGLGPPCPALRANPFPELEQSTDSRRVRGWDPRAQPSEPILFP
ncbi:hypothetical protein PIB30_112509, partial [Stylosanthes scabra]|nr:hypothetical protein [Stylosanthes scabra]